MKIFGTTYKSSISLIRYISLGLALCALSPISSFAAFDVMEEDANYGNAQNQTFQRAIDNTEPLDAEDRVFLSRVEEKRVGNRSYLKAQIGRPRSQLLRVSNETIGVPGQPAVRDVDEDVFHIMLGIGYKWVRFAVELELLISETFDYATNPALSNPVFFPPPGGTAIQLSSDVKPWAVFANLEYEIPRFFDFIPTTFHPYVNIGVGTSVKTTNASTASIGGAARQIKSERSNDFAWHFGLGTKYQITGNLLIDFAYRWMALGDVKFGPIEGITLRATDLDTNGFYLGLTYQL